MKRRTEDKPLVLVAMGGHAFMQKGEQGTVEDHTRNAERIAERLMTLVERDYDIVISHGNGPQVGNLLIQTEAARGRVPEMPLDVLVAMTEGSLGYILQQALLNQLRRRNVRRFVVTVVTQVEVDDDDPAFESPSKPIGPVIDEEEALRRRDTLGWSVVEDLGRGWRRRVASPRPIRVIQRDMVRDAARQGHIVVACGGGGIPVHVDANDDFAGVEAVIDKDLTSAVLAEQIGAELLIILTAEPQAYLNFGTPQQEPIGAVTLRELERLFDEGHFPPGSMGPKVEGVIQFLRAGGRRALITDPDNLPDAIEGQAGSHFVGKL